MKIAFFGNTKYSQIDAKNLHEKLGLQLIVTKPDKPQGRKRILTPNPVKEFGESNNIPVITTEKLDEAIADEIKGYNLDFIVVADYGLIVPDSILEIPKFAPLNIHHSLLPKFRGPSPAPSAILAGETKSGVTIIKMTSEVDAGDIYAQQEYELKPDETTDSLLTTLNQIGSDLVCNVIENFQSIKPQTQNDKDATFTPRMTKKDGFIHIKNTQDKDKLDRMIRAYFPWPTVWTEIDGKIFKLLPNKQVQPEGKKPMHLKDFLNGYPHLKNDFENLVQ